MKELNPSLLTLAQAAGVHGDIDDWGNDLQKFAGSDSGEDGFAAGGRAGAGRVQGTGSFIGAITGAAMCFGTPAVPFCAAAGAFIGANVPGNDGSNSSSGTSNPNIGDYPGA